MIKGKNERCDARRISLLFEKKLQVKKCSFQFPETQNNRLSHMTSGKGNRCYSIDLL